MDKNNNTGVTYAPVAKGSTIPAAVSPATVAEPTQTRITVAMSHANIKGEIAEPWSISPMYSLTPLSINTCFNAPAPAIMSNTIVIPVIALATESITSFIFLPLARPKV